MGLLLCGSFSKLVHLARSTPPSLVAEALKGYDDDVRQCFSASIDRTDKAWLQAQLNASLIRGGLGLHVIPLGLGLRDDRHLNCSITSSIMPSFLHLTPSKPMTSLTQCTDKAFLLPSSKTISSWNFITQPPCLIKLAYSVSFVQCQNFI